MENLNSDQTDTVCKAWALEPRIQIMRITQRKSVFIQRNAHYESGKDIYLSL